MSAALSVLKTRNFSKMFLRARQALEFFTAWVKMRRTRIEHMSAGLPLKPDIARRGWHGRKVPAAEEDAIRRKPLPNGVGPGLRDLGVVLRIHARHADAADNLAADHDRDAAFHQIDPGYGEIPQSRATARNNIL